MIKEAIAKLIEGKSLSAKEASDVMGEIMEGEATPAQFGAFVTALRLKGETVEEITGLARIMRQKAIPVKAKGLIVDTCGTGGDGAGTFNISTAAAFVVAAAGGLKVAKHGNRAMSSCCGSADVLEALGVKIDLNAEQVSECLDEVGIGFMFAPLYHPAMKYAAAPRRELGIRTIFNILGPMTNPAGASVQLLGVADGRLCQKLASVLKELGCRHALVVHDQDGLDEITVSGKTDVCELKDGKIECYTISPQDFGLNESAADSLKGGDAAANAALLRRILSGDAGPQRDAVVMNAAAALLTAGRVQTFKEGSALAQKLVDSGKALQKLERLIEFSQGFK
jgi:anthranilate phosphoribosyltransferase